MATNLQIVRAPGVAIQFATNTLFWVLAKPGLSVHAAAGIPHFWCGIRVGRAGEIPNIGIYSGGATSR
jgi:hypothetical protein